LNVLILGVDGYIGWSLAMHLSRRGHTVTGIDNLSRRRNVESLGSTSGLPIRTMNERIFMFKRIFDKEINFYEGNLLDYDFLQSVVIKTFPDCIVHLGEQPSAPFSMMDREHAIYTQHNNIEGTLNVLYAIRELVPKCHLLKLGTMGEYGTPNIDISEGLLEIEYHGRKDRLPFPRQPNSIYHLSKVHDSANTAFASRVWDLAATDIMQGVVYGTRTDEMFEDSLCTRFDFDECFGTVVNRFCTEAVLGLPLTLYGQGTQKRGFIDLIDSVQCLRIAVENPPDTGEYRVFNQLDEVYSLTELAKYVIDVGKGLGLSIEAESIANPRLEKEEHYYNVEHNKLKQLGFRPIRTIEKTIYMMLADLLSHRDILVRNKNVILPKTTWIKGIIGTPTPIVDQV
jgi:UDP-sulfoquinovose synthase